MLCGVRQLRQVTFGMLCAFRSATHGTRLVVASHPCLHEASSGSQGLALHVFIAPSCFKSGLQLTVDQVMSYMRGCRIGLRLHSQDSTTRRTIPSHRTQSMSYAAPTPKWGKKMPRPAGRIDEPAVPTEEEEANPSTTPTAAPKKNEDGETC